jgi:F-type H+-transporting ATPase subunit gamma
MANNLRDIRRKMKAIKSTKQVTKAMQLVAASKMRRATQNAQALRRYALTAWSILRTLAKASPAEHPLLLERPVKRSLTVFFTSDRGLCGSFNANLARSLLQFERTADAEGRKEEREYAAVGRKGQQLLARTGRKVVAAFPALSNHPRSRDALPIAKLALDGFLSERYDRVILVYSMFISALVQEPQIKVLLPLSDTGIDQMIREFFPRQRLTKEEQRLLNLPVPKTEYMYEPSMQEVLARILPQLTELQIYQAALESAASEHSARMVAMQNATDNASDLLSDLTLTYNQTRQGIITAELAELSASAAALS